MILLYFDPEVLRIHDVVMPRIMSLTRLDGDAYINLYEFFAMAGDSSIPAFAYRITAVLSGPKVVYLKNLVLDHHVDDVVDTEQLTLDILSAVEYNPQVHHT